MKEKKEIKEVHKHMRFHQSWLDRIFKHQNLMKRKMKSLYPSNFTEFVEVACDEKINRERN